MRLLQEEALEAGFDPFLHPATPADRLALLMERLDGLDVRHHDMRGNPAPFLGKMIQRIDRLKDEMVTAGEYLRLGALAGRERGRGGPRGGPAGGGVRAASMPPTTSCSTRRG